ncbi:MAG: DUF1616 domain-containing protein [Methanobacterium sp.]
MIKTLNEDSTKKSKNGKFISIILIILLASAIAVTAYIIVVPLGESFTEFYILGPSGVASDYPTNLSSDENGSLIIGIVNHENKKELYHLVVTSDNDVQINQIVTLNNQQTLEIPFHFTAGQPGTMEIDFMLYKLPDNTNVYRSLHLWINIT